MPSPFPGMNPYLEQPGIWPGFHNKLASELQTLITGMLPPGYYAELGEEIYLREAVPDGDRVIVRPDVWVGARAGGPVSSLPTVASPLLAVVELPAHEELRLWNIEVRDDDEQLVTVLEILSPTNKSPGPDRRIYLAKRNRLLRSNAHLVEIDLLRAGPRMPMTPAPAQDYCLMVSRVESRPQVEVWSFALREPLPDLPVPLRSPSQDLLVSLRTALDRCYDGAGYGRRLYRTASLDPPVSEDDLQWIRKTASVAAD